MSVISLRGAARCFFVTESADGCMVSRRCNAMVTRETLTGADTPMSGRISTLPSIRGYDMSAMASTLVEGESVIQRLDAAGWSARRPLITETDWRHVLVLLICPDSQPGSYCLAVLRRERRPTCSFLAAQAWEGSGRCMGVSVAFQNAVPSSESRAGGSRVVMRRAAMPCWELGSLPGSQLWG